MTTTEARDEALKGVPAGRQAISAKVSRKAGKLVVTVTHAPTNSATIADCKTYKVSYDA